MQRHDVEHLLSALFQLGLHVSADNDMLRVSGAKDAMTPELAARIRDMKPQILAFLAQAHSAPDAASAIQARKDTHPPLSNGQSRIWFIEQMMPGQPTHNISFTIEARGQLDLKTVQFALDTIVQRHAVLRTRIALQDGAAAQTVDPLGQVPVSIVDARQMSDDDVQTHIREASGRPFDLSYDLPLRLTIFERADDHCLLVFTLHHIAGDGTSVDVLIREFSALYVQKDKAALPGLPVQYGDYAAWRQARPDNAAQDRFWDRTLGQALPVTQLTTDFPRPPARSTAGNLQSVAVDKATTDALRGVAQAQAASLFATVFAAFNLLLYRYTGQRDLIVGTPTANRRPETEQLIGLFVNPLPVRSQVDPGNGFRDHLKQFQTQLWETLEHQDTAFERLVNRYVTARDPSVTPLFQIKFQLDAVRQDRISLPGVQLTLCPRQAGISHHDLSLNLTETEDGLRGGFEYSTDLFQAETVAELADNFATLLASIVADPDKPIGTLDLLPPHVRHKQLVEWNDTEQPLDPNACFQHLFESHAAATPDALAFEYVAEGQVLSETYGALNARANRLAHALRARGAQAETVIGIALDRGPDMVAAWLAVLKSGAAYLPLDPNYPAERLAYMLEDSGASLVLSHSDIALPDTVERLDLDTGWPEGPETNPDFITKPEDLAYLIYTSGSTGKPKGVLVPHAGIINMVRDKIRTCDVWPGDKVLNFFSFSFDASIPELVMSLGAGAAVVLAPAADLLPGPGLGGLLLDRRITHMTMTPSALLALPEQDYLDLKMVLVGGEPPSPELINQWSKGRIFINAYGPTETTVNASMVVHGAGLPTEPTLSPPANKQLYVLDENLQPLPVGCLGELYIGGVGLARGYLNRPAQTAAAFLPNPFGPGRLYKTGDRATQLRDGRIKVLGRIDGQVKIRGYRIELGEIEQVLLDHPEVASAIVTTHEVKPGDKRLVAYVVAKGSRPAADNFRQDYLGTRLPRFLQPDAVIWLDALPLTVNSKVDMRALPAPDFTAGQGRAPEGETEQALAGIFAEVLEVDHVSVEDDFFDLGGHSLIATRLTAMIEDRLGQKVGILDLFNAPNVTAVARLIAGEVQNKAQDWQADLRLDDSIQPNPHTAKSGLGNAVFLTGATGFLGAHLLAEMLQDPTRQVWCLTRSGGLDRIRGALQRYALWQDHWSDRIHPVDGDLGQPRLGLNDADYADLVARVTAILHCGAKVNHMQPYRRLRAANVTGTVEVLKLAAETGAPVHYLSTLSAFAHAGHTRFSESDRMAAHAAPQGGYNQSKWVAEQLVQQAADRGLPVNIYRVGSVSGHSETGHFNTADILARMLQGYLTSGIAPKGDALINVIPVDYASRLIVELAGGDLGQTFHITHSHPVSAQLLFDACTTEGHHLRRVSNEDWQANLAEIARSDPDHPLFSISDLASQFTAARDWPFDCAATRAASTLAEPPLTETLFRTYLQAFVRTGAVPKPVKKETTP